MERPISRKQIHVVERGEPMINLRHICCSGIISVLLGLLGHSALAADLVSAVLPLSRSTKIGQPITAFATVINTSGRALSGCSVGLPNFPGAFSYQRTNPTTNAVTRFPEYPFQPSRRGFAVLSRRTDTADCDRAD